MEKKPERLTIADIARLAGVSPTAVSFVLNGRSGVGAATREKVNAVIRATGFQPNPSSRRLSFQRSFNIALIYPPSASPFTDLYYYEIARGLTEKMTAEEYNVVFAALPGNGATPSLPKILARRDADGAVFFQDVSSVVLSEVDALGIPYVLVDIHAPDPGHTHVSVDSERSIYAAMRYLTGRGHGKIAFIGADWLPSYYLQCLSGYRNALADAGLAMSPAWIQTVSEGRRSEEDCLDAILACADRPTAVCCMGDVHAIRSMNAAKARGVSVPGGLSFISIDDILLSRYVDPPLTTVGYDKLRMGEIAAELLLGKMKGERMESVIVESETIVERDSVADGRERHEPY